MSKQPKASMPKQPKPVAPAPPKVQPHDPMQQIAQTGKGRGQHDVGKVKTVVVEKVKTYKP